MRLTAEQPLGPDQKLGRMRTPPATAVHCSVLGHPLDDERVCARCGATFPEAPTWLVAWDWLTLGPWRFALRRVLWLRRNPWIQP